MLSGQAQQDLKSLLKQYNSEVVPYISVNALQQEQTKVILLDAREPKEYQVSHLNNAFLVGYDHFKLQDIIIKFPNKNAKIVVYCSLGIRSEDIAHQLQKAGYTQVFNLFGGIFEWKNKGNTVVNTKGIATEKVHAFSKEWGRWLRKGEKIYE